MHKITSLKKDAIKVAHACEKLAIDCNCPESENTIQRIRTSLNDNKIVIMTIGEARTGKSSLLASYLGDEALFPVDVDVTTCLITMVTYGEKERIVVIVSDENGDENAVEIKREQIAEYAKEQNNPNNIKQAMMILIETPNEILKEGFVFVDSPGIGSLNPRHSQLTYRFLPRADLVLFVTDATSQLSESELKFLKSVYEVCRNILFVLTKKDLLYDCDEMISQNKTSVTQSIGLPADQQVWVPVSSNMLMAYKRTDTQEFLEESNFTALDHEITNILTIHRPQIIILPKLLEIKNELEKMQQIIKVAEIANSGDVEKIQLKENELEELKQKRQAIKDSIVNLDYRIKSRISEMETNLTEMFDEYAQKEMEYIDACLQKKEYAKNPGLLKTEVIGQTENEITRLQIYAADAIDSIQNELEKENGLVFDYVDPQFALNLDMGEKVIFKKNSKYQQVLQTGQDIRKNSFALNAVGGIIGGVAGGAAGFFTMGGPVGAILGASMGADLGKELGAVIGTGKGVVDVVTHGTSYNVTEVGKGLKSYVSNSVKNWNRSKQKFATNAVNAIKNTMKQKANADLSAINEMIKVLTESKRNTGVQLEKSRRQAEALRAVYNDQYAALQSLMERCVSPKAGYLLEGQKVE